MAHIQGSTNPLLLAPYNPIKGSWPGDPIPPCEYRLTARPGGLIVASHPDVHDGGPERVEGEVHPADQLEAAVRFRLTDVPKWLAKRSGFYGIGLDADTSGFYPNAVDRGIDLYVGKTVNLRRRFADHLSKIVATENLDENDVVVRFVLMPRADADWAETCILERYTPAWNERGPAHGIASKHFGKAREGTTLPPWHQVHRGWPPAETCGPPAVSDEEVRNALAEWDASYA